MAAEEVEALFAVVELDSPRLVRVQLETQALQDDPDAFLRLLAILPGAAHHHEVVRVPHQRSQRSAVAGPQDIEHVQIDVRHQRRDDPALRCARDRRRDGPVFHHPGLEPLPQQLEHPTIRDASSDQLHQLVVVDAPEGVADVGVEHVMAALGPALAQGLERHPCTALGPEAVRARKKIRLEDRLQHQLRRHLRHSVPHRRDAQRPLLSIGLRYVPASDHPRPVRACPQLLAQRFEEALDPLLLHVADRLAIDPRGAAVLPHSLPRFEQDVTPAHVVVQRVEAPSRGSLGCDPELSLQLLHSLARPTAAGVVRTGLAGHSLARTCIASMTTAGTLRSGRVVRRGHRHYYGPLGLPLRGARLRLRLIRATLP